MIKDGSYKVWCFVRKDNKNEFGIADMIVAKGEAKVVLEWGTPRDMSQEIPIRYVFIDPLRLQAATIPGADFLFQDSIDLDSAQWINVDIQKDA